MTPAETASPFKTKTKQGMRQDASADITMSAYERRRRSTRISTVACFLCLAPAFAAAYDNDQCKMIILEIQKGNHSVGRVNKDNLAEYLYPGPIDRLHDIKPNDFLMDDPYIVITRRGERGRNGRAFRPRL